MSEPDRVKDTVVNVATTITIGALLLVLVAVAGAIALLVWRGLGMLL